MHLLLIIQFYKTMNTIKLNYYIYITFYKPINMYIGKSYLQYKFVFFQSVLKFKSG